MPTFRESCSSSLHQGEEQPGSVEVSRIQSISSIINSNTIVKYNLKNLSNFVLNRFTHSKHGGRLDVRSKMPTQNEPLFPSILCLKELIVNYS